MKSSIKSKKKRKKSNSGDGRGGAFLLRHGNISLTRLLFILARAGPSGISTSKLLDSLGSIDYGQTVIRKAVKEGLVERVEGERPGPGQFPPKYNKITEKGRHYLIDGYVAIFTSSSPLSDKS